ncbi:MAG: amino acid adenylation domain-containing protein, partial [Nitrospirae bacterium]|nr:amino acid adenylation domain-containing protein [Nitrospirota bacterium]
MNKKIIHSVFESVADEFPGNIAVEEETGRTITYRELNEKANQIAFSLIECGVGRDVVVAVFIKSCIEYVASMIGIFKSGGIFMPLDPRFPARRIENILNRTSPKVFIAGSELSLSDFRHSGSGIYLPVFSFFNSNNYPVHNPPLVSDPDDGNYIVHTSGSTGEPKAILGRHKTVSHFMHWEITEFALDQETRTSQLSPSTNDVILRDIFAPLISGGTVCIPAPDTITNTNRLVQWLDKSGITLVHTVPSLLRLIMKEMETSGSSLNSVRQVLLVGEELYSRDAARWMDLTGNRAELVNLYGSSETLAKSFHRIKERPADLNKVVPIGKPISNAALLVIKNNAALCDIGELGEIYIKSPFIGKGYYKNPELTARSFVPNPINGDLSDIVYKTGDMGRYLPDRSIEYIGRLDTQVKIGGL